MLLSHETKSKNNFFLIGIYSSKAEQPLRGMELHKKEAQQRLKLTGNLFRKNLQLTTWSWNWDNNMIRISQWRESHFRINTRVRRKKQIQESRPMRITVWNPGRKVNHLGKVICDRKITTEFTRLISSTRIGKPVLMMEVKVSKDKNISRWVDRKNLIYVRWNRIKNCAQIWRMWLIEEKRVKKVRHWVK